MGTGRIPQMFYSESWFQYPSSRVILPDREVVECYNLGVALFQYPSSRVILPDSKPEKSIAAQAEKRFQYPSSRVILPDP